VTVIFLVSYPLQGVPFNDFVISKAKDAIRQSHEKFYVKQKIERFYRKQMKFAFF